MFYDRKIEQVCYIIARRNKLAQSCSWNFDLLPLQANHNSWASLKYKLCYIFRSDWVAFHVHSSVIPPTAITYWVPIYKNFNLD